MQPQIKNRSVCIVITHRFTEKMEQVYIKFCQNLGKTSKEAYDVVEMAFGEDSMSTLKFLMVSLI